MTSNQSPSRKHTESRGMLKQKETNLTSNLSPSRKHTESRGVLKKRERLSWRLT